MKRICCKKCGYKKVRKNGKTQGLQRYKCQECGYNFTDTPQKGVSLDIKKKALVLYLEGLSSRTIARILGYSNVSIHYWLKDLGTLTKDIHDHEKTTTKKIAVMELDKMLSMAKDREEDLKYGLYLTNKTGELLLLK